MSLLIIRYCAGTSLFCNCACFRKVYELGWMQFAEVLDKNLLFTLQLGCCEWYAIYGLPLSRFQSVLTCTALALKRISISIFTFGEFSVLRFSIFKCKGDTPDLSSTVINSRKYYAFRLFFADHNFMFINVLRTLFSTICFYLNSSFRIIEQCFRPFFENGKSSLLGLLL